jgi:hypothetical protein
MLKKHEAHVISNFLQLIMSQVEMAQLQMERGQVEISKKHVEDCLDNIRKITDFIHSNTVE